MGPTPGTHAAGKASVEAVARILAGNARAAGVVSAGELFGAPGFLRALRPHVTPVQAG
ncbi:hypothetical protein [Streptomyces sp. NPDC016845]|uniref:hypothetical protein n=1 Tax=Streptomyces sp. NPDC016845 TaxID=3364972 RepID=UPI0037BE121B